MIFVRNKKEEIWSDFEYMSKKNILLIMLTFLVVSIIFIVFPASKNEVQENRAKFLSNVFYNNENIEYFGSLNGYHFYGYQGVSCSAIIGPIKIDGYNFGMYNSGCEPNLDWIGFIALKDGEIYNIQDLVDTGALKTRNIYFRIYIWNKQNDK